MAISTTDCAAEPPRSILEAVVVHLVDEDRRVLPRPPWVARVDDGEGNRKGVHDAITSRKNVVGESIGNWMVRRRQVRTVDGGGLDQRFGDALQPGQGRNRKL